MTGDAARAVPGRPVARLVTPVVWRVSLLIVLSVAVCVVGVLGGESAVGRISDDIEPTAQAHDRFTDVVSDLAAATSAFALTGGSTARKAYDAALDELVRATADLEEQTAHQGEFETVVASEVEAVEEWIALYAGPIVEAGGAQGLEPTRYQLGLDRTARYDQAREATRDALAAALDDAEGAAMLRLRATVVAAVLLLVGSAVVIGRTRTRLLVEVSEPLLALEQVAQRMLRNDPEGRAVAYRGPKEVRSIARALNDFADAGSRARAVEGRIQDELHVLDSAKDDFVSNVSHELRTPLTTISGYLEMVADEFDGRLAPRHERMLEATRRNVVRLRALIDDLLALSKAETRTSELEPSDITAMVTDAVTDVRMTAARRGITVEVVAPDEPMRVVCDRAMLYRAFLNVLTNAVKFSHDDGSVEVSVARVLNRVEVAVRDHGIGIPDGEIDRLGTRFFRASNAMTHEIAGTGLGLRIVQTIIDKHAGDVVIESAQDQGTTVFVRLRLHGERVGATPLVVER